MKRLAVFVVVLALCVPYTFGQEKKSKELERVDAAQKVLNEIMATPDKGIPAKILTTADCLAIIPSMVKVGFGFGGRYGRGIATCRTTSSPNRWSAPVPIRIEGGSWGLQFGGQAIDLVMVIANRKGLDQLLTSKVKIGGDVGAAAGPVGRDAEVGTDWKMRTKVLTYSRSRGVFAGATINGSVLKQDTDDTLALYGRKFIPYDQILSGQVAAPAGTQPFLAEVAKYFREAREGEVAANKKAPPSGTKEHVSRATEGTGGVAGTASSTREETARSESSPTGSVSAPAGTATRAGENANPTAAGNSSASPDQVKSAIQDAFRNTANLDASNVGIDVTDDAVVLSGSVPSTDAKKTVERIARENAGGRKVIADNLAVK